MGNEIENLNLDQVDAALQAGGYTDNRLTVVNFRGYTVSGKARYEIVFDDDGAVGDGFVYIENVPGVGFVADF